MFHAKKKEGRIRSVKRVGAGNENWFLRLSNGRWLTRDEVIQFEAGHERGGSCQLFSSIPDSPNASSWRRFFKGADHRPRWHPERGSFFLSRGHLPGTHQRLFAHTQTRRSRNLYTYRDSTGYKVLQDLFSWLPRSQESRRALSRNRNTGQSLSVCARRQEVSEYRRRFFRVAVSCGLADWSVSGTRSCADVPPSGAICVNRNFYDALTTRENNRRPTRGRSGAKKIVRDSLCMEFYVWRRVFRECNLYSRY